MSLIAANSLKDKTQKIQGNDMVYKTEKALSDISDLELCIKLLLASPSKV